MPSINRATWRTAMICTAFLLALSSQAWCQTEREVASSDFESGLAGWSGTEGVSWASTGGNPGGYVRFVDGGPATGGQISAPAQFLGDLSALDGRGFIEFDYRIETASAPLFAGGSIRLTGPGGQAVYRADLPTVPLPWERRRFALEAARWEILSGDWAALLANVTELRIYMPTSSVRGERTGVDNVRLVELLPPCPADIDRDGALTLFDFLEFQNLFDTGDPRADFDGDGQFTNFDFLAFQNAFDAGCP